MYVLLAYFALMLVTGTRAVRRGRPNRAWPLVIASVVVTIAFLSRRAY